MSTGIVNYGINTSTSYHHHPASSHSARLDILPHDTPLSVSAVAHQQQIHTLDSPHLYSTTTPSTQQTSSPASSVTGGGSSVSGGGAGGGNIILPSTTSTISSGYHHPSHHFNPVRTTRGGGICDQTQDHHLPSKIKFPINSSTTMVKWSDDLSIVSGNGDGIVLPTLNKKWKSEHISSSDLGGVGSGGSDCGMSSENDQLSYVDYFNNDSSNASKYCTMTKQQQSSNQRTFSQRSLKHNAGTQTPFMRKHKESVV